MRKIENWELILDQEKLNFNLKLRWCFIALGELNKLINLLGMNMNKAELLNINGVQLNDIKRRLQESINPVWIWSKLDWNILWIISIAEKNVNSIMEEFGSIDESFTAMWIENTVLVFIRAIDVWINEEEPYRREPTNIELYAMSTLIQVLMCTTLPEVFMKNK